MKLIQKGFTLVELLIVVIILAILAAIVIPQFSSSTKDAQESALDSNLNALRSAIDLYKAQHNGIYPGVTVSSGVVCTVGSAGTAAVNSEAALIDQLTNLSNSSGGTCSGADPLTKLGPYLRKGIPADPFSSPAVSTVVVVTGGVSLSSGAAVPGAATGGWKYDTKTGQIVMNSNAADSKGQLYYTH